MTKIKNPILFSVICLILIAVCGGLFIYLSKHEDEVFKTKKTSSYSTGGDYSVVTDSTIDAMPSESIPETTLMNTEPHVSRCKKRKTLFRQHSRKMQLP